MRISYKGHTFKVDEMTTEEQNQLKLDKPELYERFKDFFPKTKKSKVEEITEINPT